MECSDRQILLVEDDPVGRRFLADNLLADGYDVLQAGNVKSALSVLATTFPALALIDVGLPDGDGLELIGLIRGSDRVAGRFDPELPIIVVSGRGTEVERLRGFARGADDYVVKPASFLELVARIEALLRRRTIAPAGARMRIGPLELDVLSRQTWLDGVPVPLSGKEFGLLRALAAEPGRTFTRDELLADVWGYHSPGVTRTIDAHACRLRRKLSRGGANFVINVWGIGYRLIDGSPR